MNTKSIVSILIWAGSVGLCHAQVMPPPPNQGQAPLLHVRILGSASTQITAFQGDVRGQVFQGDSVFGLRPGYIHRLKISGLPRFEQVELYPSFEVAGTLNLPSHQRGCDYPAAISFTDDDVLRAIAGTMVTKVVYLEHPEKAVPISTTPNTILEREVQAELDPMAEARFWGRPVLIVRFGGRQLTMEQMARGAIPGTILLPGQNSLAQPPVPPCLPFGCYTPPMDECISDGGDRGLKAGLDSAGKLRNVDPSDTVAEYKDVVGDRHVTASNRVCLCVPRFGIIKTAAPLAGIDTSMVLSKALSVQESALARQRTPSLLTRQVEIPLKERGRLRPSLAISQQGPFSLLMLQVLEAVDLQLGTEDVIATTGVVRLTQPQIALIMRKMELAQQLSKGTGPSGVEQTEGALVIGKMEGTDEITRTVVTKEVMVCCKDKVEAPAGPLVLCKWVDRHVAQVGDTVTFYLKFTNVGGQSISDVAVTDSLTTRLEYVSGSAKSDRPSVFSMVENEAGSLKLRWEIGEKVLAGQNGVVSFQAKIR